MSASHFDGYSRTPLRTGLAVLAGATFLFEALSLWDQVNDGFFRPRDAVLLELLPPTLPLLAVLSLVVLGSLVAFARGRHPLPGGFVALAGMAPVSQWGLEITGSTSHNFYYPASMVFGWCVGLLYARWLTARGFDQTLRGPDEQFGEAGVVGVIAALYVGSGMSKLLENGLDWANPNGLRAVLLSQQGLVHTGWNDAYRALVIDHPTVSMGMSVATLVIELGAFALLVNRPLRVLWGLLILGLHLNIMVLAHIPYLEPMFLVPLFALPWPWLFRMRRVEPAPRPAMPATELPFPRAFVAVALALSVLSFLLPRQERGDGRPQEADSKAPRETAVHRED